MGINEDGEFINKQRLADDIETYYPQVRLVAKNAPKMAYCLGEGWPQSKCYKNPSHYKLGLRYKYHQR